MYSRFIFLFLIFLSVNVRNSAQPLAFPGAEGGGKFTTGGRGGKTIFVDNLNDKGKGSFRHAIEEEGARTILFRVSGNIELSKPIYIKHGNITIAGQSAPGDGICLVNYGIVIEADNVIIRFLRVRPGDKAGDELDAISGKDRRNIIIDHCSFSWATDEVASLYDNTDFTMQWCIIGESLNQSVHHKGNHGYGGIWGGKNASFHHNLIACNASRNPRFCGSRYTNNPETEYVDFRNNLIYNWGFNNIYGGEEGNYNMVNNYFKSGPATEKDVQFRILELTQSFFDPKLNDDTLKAGKFYIKGNFVEGYPEVTKENWRKGVQGKSVGEPEKLFSRLKKPVPHTPMKTDKPAKAYAKIIETAGASHKRDQADKQLFISIKNGQTTSGNGIINSQNDVGGWPPLQSGELLPDSDNDGIPDEWELRHGLDPKNPNDANACKLHKTFTNIEVYINTLIEHLIF